MWLSCPTHEATDSSSGGFASAESREAARDLVEDQIYDASLDLIILEPGVWVDESIRG